MYIDWTYIVLVLPAVLLPLARAGQADEDAVCDALYVAAGFGQVIAARATLAGAEGGCQAEVGAASAMAAAALCNLKGGTPEQCAAAAAMALGSFSGFERLTVISISPYSVFVTHFTSFLMR